LSPIGKPGDWTTDESQVLFRVCRLVSGMGSVAVGCRRAADRFLRRRSGRAAGRVARLWPVRGRWARRRRLRACGRSACSVVGCGWARVDDVSKRRRQGLVVCRVTCPFEGLIYARPGVTLAPTFAGLLACQSRTIRV
jgi:hypothetical protein